MKHMIPFCEVPPFLMLPLVVTDISSVTFEDEWKRRKGQSCREGIGEKKWASVQ